MLERLKRIILRLRSSGGWLPPPTRPPEGPDIGVREPRGRRPSAGSAAVAVVEPDEPRTTIVAGHPQRSPGPSGSR
jgi:hypothetical protein